MQWRYAACSVLAAWLIVATGCRDDEIGTTHPVQGVVLLNGQPIKVTNGHVMLKPDSSRGNTTMLEPSGVIDADGKYQIFTGSRRGAPPGWYRVIVTGTGEPPKPKKGADHSRPIANSLVAPKYGQEKTTPLSIEVVASPQPGAYDLKIDP